MRWPASRFLESQRPQLQLQQQRKDAEKPPHAFWNRSDRSIRHLATGEIGGCRLTLSGIAATAARRQPRIGDQRIAASRFLESQRPQQVAKREGLADQFPPHAFWNRSDRSDENSKSREEGFPPHAFWNRSDRSCVAVLFKDGTRCRLTLSGIAATAADAREQRRESLGPPHAFWNRSDRSRRWTPSSN